MVMMPKRMMIMGVKINANSAAEVPELSRRNSFSTAEDLDSFVPCYTFPTIRSYILSTL